MSHLCCRLTHKEKVKRKCAFSTATAVSKDSIQTLGSPENSGVIHRAAEPDPMLHFKVDTNPDSQRKTVMGTELLTLSLSFVLYITKTMRFYSIHGTHEAC